MDYSLLRAKREPEKRRFFEARARIRGCSPLITPKQLASPENRAVRQSAQTLFRFSDRADFEWPD